MNKITILGSGDTLGTPVVGDHIQQIKTKRTRFGLLLEINGKKILIDTNPDLREQCLRLGLDLKTIDNIFVTHTHPDHVNGMGEFFYRKEAPIPTYHLEHPLINSHTDSFRYLEREKVLNFLAFENYQPIKLENGMVVTPIELNHGFPCSGFVIEFDNTKIGIVSDTNLKLKEKSLDLLNNCDILFADAFSEDLEQVSSLYDRCGITTPNLENEWFHMTISEAIDLQRKTNSKKLYTVHMSSFMSSHDKLVDKYQTDNVVVGYDLCEIQI